MRVACTSGSSKSLEAMREEERKRETREEEEDEGRARTRPISSGRVPCCALQMRRQGEAPEQAEAFKATASTVEGKSEEEKVGGVVTQVVRVQSGQLLPLLSSISPSSGRPLVGV